MSQAIPFMARGVSGLGPPDSQCLPSREVSRSAVCVSPYPSCGQNKSSLKLNHSRCTIRNASLACRASSGSHRRNSDFSRQNKHGFSRKRNWQNEDRDGYDSLEESEILSSKNGPLLSASGTSRFQATATPGPREKEIVELFRKVQAKLRQRAAVKDEKKIEESQKKGKETETVDSLLKLLRKHSIRQGKVSSDSNSSGDFTLDHPVQNGPISEERSTASVFDSNSSVKHEKRETEAPVVNRPSSNFQRRSPVPQVKVQPVFSNENTPRSVSWANSDQKIKEKILEPEFDVEPDNDTEADPSFSDDDVYDEISGIYDDDDDDDEDEDDDNDNDTGDGKDDNNIDDDVPEPNAAEHSNLSEMKLTELRALAKSRGLKGFSKLKKQELFELLVGVKI